MEKEIEKEIRLGILILVCFVSYIVYWFFSIIVFIPDYCSGVSDYWLYGDDYSSPFWMFVIVFSLIITWSIVELIDSFIAQENRVFTVAVVGVVFIFHACFFAGHYTLWQIMEVQKGRSSVDSFLFTYEYFDLLKQFADKSSIPDVHEYLKQESCKNGVEVFDLRKADRQILLMKYHQLVLEIMESNSKTKLLE